MADEKTRYVICYDVIDDRRRTKLARALDAFGDRVQYSVFEALLDALLFDKMVRAIEREIDLTEDRVTIYAICASCVRRRIRIGIDADRVSPGDEVVFIA